MIGSITSKSLSVLSVLSDNLMLIYKVLEWVWSVFFAIISVAIICADPKPPETNFDAPNPPPVAERSVSRVSILDDTDDVSDESQRAITEELLFPHPDVTTNTLCGKCFERINPSASKITPSNVIEAEPTTTNLNEMVAYVASLLDEPHAPPSKETEETIRSEIEEALVPVRTRGQLSLFLTSSLGPAVSRLTTFDACMSIITRLSACVSSSRASRIGATATPTKADLCTSRQFKDLVDRAIQLLPGCSVALVADFSATVSKLDVERHVPVALDAALVAFDIASLTGAQLCAVVLALQSLGVKPCRFIETRLSNFPHFSLLSASQISALAVALGQFYALPPRDEDCAAKSGREPCACKSAMDVICMRALEISHDFTAAEMASFIFAIAHLDLIDQQKLLHAFADRLATSTDECTPQVMSNTVYALARLRFRAPVLFQEICRSAPCKFSEFKSQELANLVYAFGQLQYRNEPFLVELADHIPGRAKLFKPQELSITAYAYSQLGTAPPRLLASIAEQISCRMSSCSAQAISNTVYALAKLDFKSTILLSTCAQELPGRLAELTPQHISNIMFSLGKLHFKDERFLQAVCDHVPARLGSFRPQNIANTVYATWKLSFRHEVLLRAVAAHLPSRLSECVPQDISNVVYAFGELRFSDQSFSDAVHVHVFGPRGVFQRMQPKDKSFLLSSFRRAGLEVPGSPKRR